MSLPADDRRRGALEHALANARPGDAAAVLLALDDFAQTREFLMNVGPEKGPWLVDAVRNAGAGARVLELGCFCGYSAILIAGALGSGGSLTSVEADADSAGVARRMIAHAGLDDRVEIRVGDSKDVIPTLEGPYELVFLDHWKDVYRRDLETLIELGLIVPGSVVFADNVGPHFHAEDYLDFVRGSGRFATAYRESHIEYTDREDGVEISTFEG